MSEVSQLDKMTYATCWQNFLHHVLALQEMWSVNPSLTISGYQPVIFNFRDKGRTKNSNIGGEVAFFIRIGLEFEILEKQSIFRKGIYESLWIKISLPKKKFLIIGNIYRPNTLPLGSADKAIEIHSTILDDIKSNKVLNKAKLYIASDFNIDLASISTNSKANFYLDLHLSMGLISMINISAHLTNTSSKVIDHIFLKTPHDDIKSGVLEVDLSDHMPTFISDHTILSNIPEQPATRPLITSVTIHNYLNLLSKLTFSQSEDPKISFDNFFQRITDAALLAFPLTSPKNNKKRKDQNLG